MPSEVWVDGRLYVVRRATVGEAFAVLAASEDEAAWPSVERMARAWLPVGLGAVIFSKVYGRALALSMLSDFLRFGLPEPEDPKQTSDHDKTVRKAQEVGAMKLVATYAHAFHVAPSVVLSEPWALFVGMLGEIDRVRAVDQADSIGWYAAVKSGKAENIYRRAFGDAKRPDLEVMDDERFARHMESARRYRESRQNMAEA
jgi:hypothetical protein